MNIFEHEAKQNAVFAALCKKCGDRWGIHAVNGCMKQGCNCKTNGITAIRSMMKDPKFKFTYVPPIEVKETTQVKLFQ